MTISIAHLQPIVALVAGILILVTPRLLNIIVAVYLILIGLLGIGLYWPARHRSFQLIRIAGLRRAIWRCF
jgi:hypothetical protein